jgi:hypothetical protein
MRAVQIRTVGEPGIVLEKGWGECWRLAEASVT